MTISFNNLRNMNSTPISGYIAYYDNTTFTARSVSAATDLYADTAVAGHHLYFVISNCCNKPRGISFNVTTAMASTSHTITWEYRKADNTWAAFSGVTDNTTGFTVAGTVTWTVPTDWGTDGTSIATYTGRLWWRARISAATAITEGGRVTSITQIYDNAVRVDANHEYDSGTATSGAKTTITNTGKAYATNVLMQRIIYIHTGTGSGQVRVVRSNTATVITVYDQWETTPDNTSQYCICANFEDLYQADVSGGWGVITKQGNNSYYFNCYLDLNAGAFGDVNKMVEFNDEYYFYNSAAATSRYQVHLGWRLPLINDGDKGLFGNKIITNRTTPLDSRLFGFNNSFNSDYIFTSDNRFEVVDKNYGDVGVSSYLKVWFYHHGKYSINDVYIGWRSVIFGNTSTEVRNVTVKYGYSGLEALSAAVNNLQSYYNIVIALYLTNSSGTRNPKDLYLGPNNLNNTSTADNRFQSFPIAYYGHSAATDNIIDYKGVRFRPMNDVYGSVSSIGGFTYSKYKVRLQLVDESNNPIANGKVIIKDSGSPQTVVTATTGSSGEFLNNQSVTSGASYSLSSQPVSGTRLRVVITGYSDASASAAVNARIWLKGTDDDGNAIQDYILLETIGNGTYYTRSEFKTVDTSGIVTFGFTGTMTIDRMGSIYPQTVTTEQWTTTDDVTTTVVNYNPFTIKMSAPGFDQLDWKDEIMSPFDDIMVLKRSELNVR